MLLTVAIIIAVTQAVCDAASKDERIKHVVVLMLENRPFDHFFGWFDGVNGLTGNEYNLVDPSDPQSERVFVDSKAPFLNECDPCHSTPCTTQKLFSKGTDKPADMGGFVNYQNSSSDENYCNVMQGFPPEKVPILSTLASEFGIMDRFFASHPGPTWPNRMFSLTATSAGSTETSCWYHDIPGKLYPQKTIYDQVAAAGKTWKNYFNDTPWELILESVAHSPHNLHPLDQFYTDAREGNLPSFSWINPRSGMNVTTGVGSNDQHPDHDVSAGEQYIKDIYEALRGGKGWEETLFVITYDEHGGFYDHVVPPSAGVPPPGDGETSYPDPGFKFDRLGVRLPTLLISPWIKKGSVFSEPPEFAKPANNSEYELTSIISTARILLGIKEGPLTDRDAWAATFDHTIFELDEPRVDCPLHLPEALPPTLPSSVEQRLMLNHLQVDISQVHHYLGGRMSDIPTTQGELSEWLVSQYESHVTSTKDWLLSKQESAGEVKVVAKVKPLFVGHDQDPNWVLNGLPFGATDDTYSDSKAPYITLSTNKLRRRGTDEPYCLDAGQGKVGSRVTASACYPSRDPSNNRDPMQHFNMHPDGTLRLYNPKGDDHLCVTNSVFADYYRRGLVQGGDSAGYTAEQQDIKLEECNDDVNQTFAYHGIAPGYTGNGKDRKSVV